MTKTAPYSRSIINPLSPDYHLLRTGPVSVDPHAENSDIPEKATIIGPANLSWTEAGCLTITFDEEHAIEVNAPQIICRDASENNVHNIKTFGLIHPAIAAELYSTYSNNLGPKGSTASTRFEELSIIYQDTDARLITAITGPGQSWDVATPFESTFCVLDALEDTDEDNVAISVASSAPGSAIQRTINGVVHTY